MLHAKRTSTIKEILSWIYLTLFWVLLLRIFFFFVKVLPQHYSLSTNLKWKSCPTLWDPMDYIVHGILQARKLEWVAVPFSRGSSKPRDGTQVSRSAGTFFTSEPPGKPKNTGVGSLSFLQEIFPTQESNQGLLHCRQILYQLSYQGSPLLT